MLSVHVSDLNHMVLSVFSPQGHILVLAGFGNLRGQMEVWDLKKYKQVRKKSRDSLCVL